MAPRPIPAPTTHRQTLFVLFVAVSLVAGCLQTGDEGDDEIGALPEFSVDWPALALPYGDSHSHSDLDAHRGLSTPNFHQLGWDPLITEYHGSTSGDHFCGGVSHGERQLAVIHSLISDVAFVLADISDPENPEMLGEFILKRVRSQDVDITTDGQYVVVGTVPTGLLADGEDPTNLMELLRGPAVAPVKDGLDAAAQGLVQVEMGWRDACTGETNLVIQELPLTPGTILVDVSDPSDPQFADFKPSPVLGPHSIHIGQTADGTQWVLASITNLAHQASYFVFYTIEESLLGPVLAEYGVVTAEYIDPNTEHPLVNGHVDGWVATHPGTGQDLAYLANWNGGLMVAELAGPGDVNVIGYWNDYTFIQHDPSETFGPGMTGQIHSTYPIPEMWDDRHYTVIGQEVTARPEGRPTGQMILMDTTDPTDPHPVARWTLPHDPGDWGGDDEFLLYSTHYATVVDKTMFVSMYHAGVWAVDLSQEGWPELPSLGVFIPDERSPSPPVADIALFGDWTPMVMDVLRTKDDNLVLWDGTSGVYVVSFDATMEVPIPEPWTKDAWID